VLLLVLLLLVLLLLLCLVVVVAAAKLLLQLLRVLLLLLLVCCSLFLLGQRPFCCSLFPLDQHGLSQHLWDERSPSPIPGFSRGVSTVSGFDVAHKVGHLKGMAFVKERI
jgi:hypothetical protein